ncbi:hypothetical protein IHE45_02G054000 [Dioscorea alata]|uniref:Uncharacterized protein n=3 Tax=Dioscorea alata TaxID=55571 RepID=A0ACB7WPQ0_DIOAL|nr:hypothetical protein IHE45_02G054000 [Dioscorea alata]KAH7690525.1 hypothetical protein IHE45_02G054000 [Dioscorea alata]KAH7690526.1 hypothetical protein IHE45_02G054000 [Dioscorea alata]
MDPVPAASGLTPFVTSNVTNGWFQGYPNDGQKTMLHIAILSLVCLFCCSVSVNILKSNTNQDAGIRCFQGLITIFSVMSIAMLSACILPGYFKWLSCFFCSIPVIVHTIFDKRWFRDWFSKLLCWFRDWFSKSPILPISHQGCNSKNGDQELSHVGEAVEQIHAINIPAA